MHAHTGKSLFKYALTAKNTFILALVMLAIGVAAELAGPFIARAMIDDHMLAIEQPFYETASQNESTVLYDGRYFKRGDRFAESEAKGGEVRVLQAGTSFLFIDEPVADVTGDRSFKDGVLTIARKDGTVSEYPAQKLSASGLFAFYKPEVPGIISLIIWYFVFLAVSIVMEFGKTYWLQSSANKVIRKLRMDVYAHIQRLPVYFFDNLPAGKVVSRVTNDTEAVKDLFIAVLANFFPGLSICWASMWRCLFSTCGSA